MAENAKSGSATGAARGLTRLPQLADSILQFDFVREIAQLRQEDSWQRGTGRSARTLVKHPDFRVVLTLMKANTRVNEHQTDARISIQTIMGKIRLHLPAGTVELSAGEILVLDCDVPHDVEAIEESAFLLTVGARHVAAK